MMKDKKLIVFDLDGTLIDTEPTSIESWIIASREFNFELKREEILKFIGRNVSGIKDLSLKLRGENYPFDEIYERKRQIAMELFKEKVNPMPYAKESLQRLKEMGFSMCVATSSARQRSLNFLEKAGLSSYIDFLISGEEVEHSKPDPEIFNKAITMAGYESENAIIVEDSLNGIKGARASGARVVLIPDMLKIEGDDLKYADHVFSNLKEFVNFIEEEYL